MATRKPAIPRQADALLLELRGLIESGMPSPLLEHGGHHVFLADIGLGNVLDPTAMGGRQFVGRLTDFVSQRFSKARVRGGVASSGQTN